MVIHSKSHIHKHNCTAALICCMDFRFWKATINFVQNTLGIYDFDLVTHAGAAKVLVEKDTDVIDVLEKHLVLAKELHQISMIVIANHQDCGVYGGSGKFKNEKEESDHHSQHVKKGIELLQKRHKDIKFIGLFAYFNKFGGIDFKRIDLPDKNLRKAQKIK